MIQTISTQVIRGSLAETAKARGQSIAETFIGADAIVIVDTSGSMDIADSRGGLTRYAVACQELARLQNDLPGRIAVIAFSDNVIFCPDGHPPSLGEGTQLHTALRFAQVADILPMRFFVISDGYPDNAAEALSIATTYHSRIDTIHVGAENDVNGREFLRQLASVKGGSASRAGQAVDLANVTERLLQSG